MICELALAALLLTSQGAERLGDALELTPQDGAPPGEAEPAFPAMELAWSVDRKPFISVAVDPERGLVYGLSMFRHCMVIDARGLAVRELSMPQGAGGKILAANVAPGPAHELLFFDHGAVTAIGADGELLWSYDPPHDNDVRVRDLDGDGLDEVVIGYIGDAGVHVLNPTGDLLWRSNVALGNVWRVASGDIDGDGTPEVLATSNEGVIHVFGADGESREELAPYAFVDMIRVGVGKRASPLILTIGVDDAGQRTGLIAVRADGSIAWSVALPGFGVGSRHSLEPAPSKAWAAVSRADQVVVVDTAQGRIIGLVRGHGRSPQVSWLPSDDPAGPLLLVAGDRLIAAYRVPSEQ